MDKQEIIAVALAARHDASLTATEEYHEVERALEADPVLRAEVGAEARYYDEYEELLAAVQLPVNARLRIIDAMRAARASIDSSLTAPRPTVRFSQWLALAAAVVVLIGGVFLATRPALPSMADLRTFAASQVVNGFDLDDTSAQPSQLIQWLTRRGVDVGNVGPDFMAMETMGCKVFGWNGRRLAVLCFRVDDDQVVHLFAAPLRSLRSSKPLPEYDVVLKRETRVWTDAEYAYVLVAHHPGQHLGRS